jgi:hypothetical protein
LGWIEDGFSMGWASVLNSNSLRFACRQTISRDRFRINQKIFRRVQAGRVHVALFHAQRGIHSHQRDVFFLGGAEIPGATAGQQPNKRDAGDTEKAA